MKFHLKRHLLYKLRQEIDIYNVLREKMSRNKLAIFQILSFKRYYFRKKCLRDGVAELASKAFTPTHMRDDPKIYIGCIVHRGNEKLNGYPSKEKGQLKGDILIRHPWTQETDSIQDTCVANNDATSYQYKTP